MNGTTPEQIELKQQSRCLRLSYQDGQVFDFSFEFLRVHSPSADVRGHGKNDAVLQLNKQHVNINAVEPVGHYAIKLVFDDGHDTGLYSWDYLYELGIHHDDYWHKYLTAVQKAEQDKITNE